MVESRLFSSSPVSHRPLQKEEEEENVYYYHHHHPIDDPDHRRPYYNHHSHQSRRHRCRHRHPSDEDPADPFASSRRYDDVEDDDDPDKEEAMSSSSPPPIPSEDDLVQLNVGGARYTTTAATLRAREPESFFAQLLSADGLEQHRHVSRRFHDGTYFIDRDGELFAYILDYLRNGKLLLPDNFKEMARLREEVIFFQLDGLMNQLAPYYNFKYPLKSSAAATAAAAAAAAQQSSGSGSEGAADNGNGAAPMMPPTTTLTAGGGQLGPINPLCETGGFITLGYRGTFAFGRDGQADVKFRKLYRILVCGKAQLCREVFGDTLNESRDPDREGTERYTSRLYLKHQCLERACDNLAEKGFKLVAACSSGANGLTTAAAIQAQAANTQEYMNQRNNGDLEEQRWAHYTEYVFYREPQIFLLGASPTQSPRNN